MLFENDGSISDALNYAAEILGDGRVMDAFRAHMTAKQAAQQIEERRAIHRLAVKVKEAKERKAAFGDLGVQADFECPACHFHGYAAGAKLLALEQGIVLPCNGYGLWDDDDFVAWYKRRYPELCYNEAPRNARIVVNAAGRLGTAPLISAAA